MAPGDHFNHFIYLLSSEMRHAIIIGLFSSARTSISIPLISFLLFWGHSRKRDDYSFYRRSSDAEFHSFYIVYFLAFGKGGNIRDD